MFSITVRRTRALKAAIRRRLAEQRDLVVALLRMREQLGGSLFVRWGRCGKPACACRRGRGHGPYYVLSSRAGESRFVYLAGGGLDEARLLVTRSREFRQGLRRLRTVNRELVRLLRRYQRLMARGGERRLARLVAASA